MALWAPACPMLSARASISPRRKSGLSDASSASEATALAATNQKMGDSAICMQAMAAGRFTSQVAATTFAGRAG